MVHRTRCAATVFGGALLSSTAALAGPGNVIGNVNMRTSPGAQYPIITTIPAGAPIQVFECENWCQVGFAGTYGYVSAGYIAGGYTEPAPRPYYLPTYAPVAPVVIYEGGPSYVAPHYRWRDHHRWHYRRGDGAYFEFGS